MDKPRDYLYVCDMILSPHHVEVLVARQTRCPADWHWDTRAAPPRECILWLVVDGRGRLTIDGRGYDLHGGDCFILRPWQHCAGEHDPARPLTVDWAHFRYRDDRRRVVRCDRALDGLLPRVHRQVEHLGWIRGLFERVGRSCGAASACGPAARAWFVALLLELAHQDTLPRLGGLEREHYEAVGDLCAAIRAQPGRRWRVDRMAESMCYSAAHFTRVFRRWAGATPRAFIMAARIDAARGLLRVSNHSITRIAELMGFADVYHFSRRFREQTGLSPSAYRRGRDDGA